MPCYIRLPLIGNWSGMHYGVVRNEPLLGFCGEAFQLQISSSRIGTFSGTMLEETSPCHSAVNGSWDGGRIRFTRSRRVFLVEHDCAVVTLEDFLLTVKSSIARYHVLEPAFQYEGWYDPAVGEIRGRWFWPGFHCSIGERHWLSLGSMRGFWRMDVENERGS